MRIPEIFAMAIRRERRRGGPVTDCGILVVGKGLRIRDWRVLFAPDPGTR